MYPTHLVVRHIQQKYQAEPFVGNTSLYQQPVDKEIDPQTEKASQHR